jgi:integrase
MAKKGSNTTTSYIEWGEVQLLISRLERDKNYKFCLLVACGVYTGLRISDLLQLKYSDILGAETFVKVESKTGKRREIKVNQQLRELVQRLYEIQQVQQSDSLMFLNKYGTKPIDRCYVNAQLKVIVSKYRIKTGGNVSSHTFRKSMGRRVMDVNNYSNESLILLSEVFGHSNPSITMRYLGIRQQEVLGVYDSLSF